MGICGILWDSVGSNPNAREFPGIPVGLVDRLFKGRLHSESPICPIASKHSLNAFLSHSQPGSEKVADHGSGARKHRGFFIGRQRMEKCILLYEKVVLRSLN